MASKRGGVRRGEAGAELLGWLVGLLLLAAFTFWIVVPGAAMAFRAVFGGGAETIPGWLQVCFTWLMPIAAVVVALTAVAVVGAIALTLMRLVAARFDELADRINALRQKPAGWAVLVTPVLMAGLVAALRQEFPQGGGVANILATVTLGIVGAVGGMLAMHENRGVVWMGRVLAAIPVAMLAFLVLLPQSGLYAGRWEPYDLVMVGALAMVILVTLVLAHHVRRSVATGSAG